MSMHALMPCDGNVPLDAHPDIWMLVHYWKYIHPLGRLPGGAHLNFEDIPQLFPNMRLLDVLEGGPHRYRVRMIGPEHAKQLGYDPTGSWYETVTNRFNNSVVELDLERVRHARRPVYRKGKTIVPYATNAKIIERVHVPLAGDGYRVDRIASLTLFFPELRSFAGSRPIAKATPESGSEGSAMPATGPALGICLPHMFAALTRPLPIGF